MPERDEQSTVIRLDDYRSPPWRVVSVVLEFDLDIKATEVRSRLELARDPAQKLPLQLHGKGLEVLGIRLDGQALSPECWRYSGGILEVDGADDGSILETHVRARPEANTTLEGLYLSGPPEHGFLLTQCEAEGFRHITFFPDRPDVLARYTVTLRADRRRFPVLLSGGNPDGTGDLPDGRHWARFVDPYPKPSYLFALVAGRLEHITREYVTADGRSVKLVVWSEPETIAGCHFAMDALERAMRWDEQRYGRNYDLNVFHVVATNDFNMGAMENKGLNIFNAKYLVATPESTTDDEYRAVESVVAHEYFHNWSGNRVTCRDWFQLSLKEGLTVFRERQFSSEMNSAALRRIEDVSLLRRTQFPEDAGPLAHPVRPSRYREINNFYTATVYEKGAELVSMLAGALGPDGFRRGMDRYFAENDGRAATLEDFLDALGEANGTNLRPYLAWYGQSGTPRLRARGAYDAESKRYTLTLSQHTPPTQGQPEKATLPIPVKLALFDPDGSMIPLRRESRDEGTEMVVVLDAAECSYSFWNVLRRPVPSLLRGFSAPVILECDYAPDDLALLLAHDADGFNRWEAGQQLAVRAVQELRDDSGNGALAAWCEALAKSFSDKALDPALLADLLTPPGEIELAEGLLEVDPGAIHAVREALQRRLANRLGCGVLARRYESLNISQVQRQNTSGQAQRRLKRRVLELLMLADSAQAQHLAWAQYEAADNMTDRLGAMAVMVRHGAPQAAAALQEFRTRFADHPLTMDKWFAVQAGIPGESTLARVRALEADPTFTLRNPNRVRALLGTFAHANPTGFHRTDGGGYRLLADRLIELDALNPQVAARLATAFNDWKRLEPVRREAAREVVSALAGRRGLSPNLSEILARMYAA